MPHLHSLIFWRMPVHLRIVTSFIFNFDSTAFGFTNSLGSSFFVFLIISLKTFNILQLVCLLMILLTTLAVLILANISFCFDLLTASFHFYFSVCWKLFILSFFAKVESASHSIAALYLPVNLVYGWWLSRVGLCLSSYDFMSLILYFLGIHSLWKTDPPEFRSLLVNFL